VLDVHTNPKNPVIGDRALAEKATGQTLWRMSLPSGTTGAPMTYMFQGKQYIVVAVGDRKGPVEWVALALP